MSDDLTLEFNKPLTITMKQDCSFEDFVAQFQISCSKLLCVVNGKQLRYYDKKPELPMGLKFEYKHRCKDRTAYYFRDATNNKYCVFGREAAQQFYPRLDEVDSLTLPSVPSVLSVPLVPSTHTERNYKVTKVDKIEGVKSIVTPITHNNLKGDIAATRIVKTKYPPEIIIVDRGQRHSFPYVNYNIEVQNHKAY